MRNSVHDIRRDVNAGTFLPGVAVDIMSNGWHTGQVVIDWFQNLLEWLTPEGAVLSAVFVIRG